MDGRGQLGTQNYNQPGFGAQAYSEPRRNGNSPELGRFSDGADRITAISSNNQTGRPNSDTYLGNQDPERPQKLLEKPTPDKQTGKSMIGDKSEFKNKTVLFRSELRSAKLERDRELIDEPVLNTVGRELKSICKRSSLVFTPCLGKKAGFLKDWDLWGPLLYVLALSAILGFRADSQNHIIFATVFFSNVVGSIIITLNARFLGINAGFFETICMMGYCLWPLTAAALVTAILTSVLGYWVKFLVVLGCFLWSCMSNHQSYLRCWCLDESSSQARTDHPSDLPDLLVLLLPSSFHPVSKVTIKYHFPSNLDPFGHNLMCSWSKEVTSLQETHKEPVKEATNTQCPET